MPYFFKIMYRGLTDERLRIPPDFVENYMDENYMRNKAILKGPSGEHWNVSVSNNGKRNTYFEDGWVKFKNDHSLHGNEFLTFEYDGKMTFEVHIFGENQVNSIAAEPTADDDHIDNQERCFASSSKSKKRHEKVQVEDDDPPHVDDEQEPHCPSSGREDVPVAPQAKNKRPWKAFKSKLPHFKLSITKCIHTSFNVRIPMEFAKEHLPPCNVKMKIKNVEGESWEVWCNYNARRGYCLSGGWIMFARENNLKEGDVCIFELYKENKLYLTVFPST